MALDEEEDWHYVGCHKCSSKVSTTIIMPETEEENADLDVDMKQVLVCQNKDCSEDVATAITLYRIPVRVQDCTGTSTLTLFDKEANKLLGIYASQLIEKNIELNNDSTDQKFIPKEFDVLKGKKFAFRIQIAHFNVKKGKDGYAIQKFITDEKIIAELEKNFSIYQEEASHEINLQETNFSSQSEVSIKVAVSSTAENITPNSKGDNTPNNSSFDMKRSLDDIYDLEESSSLSSTKSQKSETDEDIKVKNKGNLLIPKVEK